VLPARSPGQESLLERVPKLDRLVLDNRLAIKSCELKIGMTREFPGQPGKKSETVELYFLVSGSKVLFTRSFPRLNPPTKSIWCRNGEADGYVIDLHDSDGKKPAIVSFVSIAKLPFDSLNNMIPEFRTIGLLGDEFGGMASMLPIDTIVGSKDRKNLTAVTDRLDGREAVRVSFRFRDSATVTYWIVPALGNSVTRLVFENDKNMRTVTTTRPKRYEPSGIWFPESVDYSEFAKEKLMSHTRCAIEIKSVNDSIDSKRFSLPALGLPPLTKIYNIPPRGEAKVWTGTALVDLRLIEPKP
jgi:hypothetical protein